MNSKHLALSPEAPEQPNSARTETIEVFTRRQRTQYWLLLTVWVILSGFFWLWWLQPGHAGNPVLFTLVSASLFYGFTLLPSFYLFYLGFMRRPVHVDVDELEPGQIGKVAVITLTVPGSESLSIVRRQMLAMNEISYPHDSWILVDKEHSPVIEEMARELGVSYFCRHDERTWGSDGVEAWNQPGPPFQLKTKAGNVNAWLDKYGAGYTHFTQLDIDHNPVPAYLDRVLGYFRNRHVAWVQAPSIYGNHEHWTARGSSEQEFVLQGPLQMGFFGFCRTPFIIGSHCTYDMEAIRRIGGFQPTRAEDHLDTVILASKGYEGVFLPEVIAVGDGPETFGTYSAQQFAWAFSMIQVLFTHTPGYPGLFTAAGTPVPVCSNLVYILVDRNVYPLHCPAALPGLGYARLQGRIRRFPSPQLARCHYRGTIIWVLWSRRWQHPSHLRLSWRGVALHVARWVTVLNAFIQAVLRVKKPYMITVKGLAAESIPRFRMTEVAPYVGLILSSLFVCWFYMGGVGHSSNQGMLFFALEGALLFWLLVAVILAQDIRSLINSGVAWRRCLQVRSAPLAASCSLLTVFVVTAVAASDSIWQAVVSS